MGQDGDAASVAAEPRGTLTVEQLKSHPTFTALANAVAGATCTLLLQPIASLRTRLQSLNIYDHGIQGGNRSKFAAMLRLSWRDGILRLYRGGGCSMVISGAGWFLFRYSFDMISHSKIVDFDNKNATKLVNGSLSSLITTAVLHPAWNAKLNMELQTSSTMVDGWPQYRGATHYLLSTFKNEGLPGLYKGWEANLIGVVYYGMVICVYESLAEVDWQQHRFLESVQYAKPIANGMIARIIPTTLCYPVYVSRTMQQCFATELSHRSLFQVFAWTLRNKRLRGLYAGFQMQLAKSVISGGITFGIYEALLASAARCYNFIHG
ncbi:mitochondrial carrier protein, putative [Babesia bigemina]|uniref:Mitochondrial carrier protein, putative n=1 Tax=Babesia bigemina TaxID=5866 RepID=A0A061D8I8_BABBI|nr:mitochondrial carrier protein, putative [Babesia bigemina]CDR96818.1 mitochondrial carrier protein, putative [Babesia bigemina]|eukprot:XP_012769004.1 mitochondrial carrier protein, putative [Babesia bigemina]